VNTVMNRRVLQNAENFLADGLFSSSRKTVFSGIGCYGLFQCRNMKIKGKAVPLQAWSGPDGSGKLMFPDFMTTAQYGGKVVSLTHRPPLPPRKYTSYSFLLEAESTPGPKCDRKEYVNEKLQ